jgi:hypothetical protein
MTVWQEMLHTPKGWAPTGASLVGSKQGLSITCGVSFYVPARDWQGAMAIPVRTTQSEHLLFRA